MVYGKGERERESEREKAHRRETQMGYGSTNKR
jgi:hypothetical protein